MTCKDCVHYEACGGFTPTDLDQDVFDYCIKGTTDEIPDIDERCGSFKNKADFVEVKHGEWLVDDFKKQNKKFLTCSECRAVIDCNVNYIDENEYDFCPYCGADMRKEGADNG